MDENGGGAVPIPFPMLLDNALFESRQIFIYGEINQKVAKDVSQKLIAMAEKSDDPIVIFINSQGGHVEAGDTIHDMIRFVKPVVKVVGTGLPSLPNHSALRVLRSESDICFSSPVNPFSRARRSCRRKPYPILVAPS